MGELIALRKFLGLLSILLAIYWCCNTYFEHQKLEEQYLLPMETILAEQKNVCSEGIRITHTINSKEISVKLKELYGNSSVVKINASENTELICSIDLTKGEGRAALLNEEDIILYSAQMPIEEARWQIEKGEYYLHVFGKKCSAEISMKDTNENAVFSSIE